MAIYLHPNRAKLASRRTGLVFSQVRDESAEPVAGTPPPWIEQTRKGVEAGQQNTDFYGTSGLKKPNR